MSRLPRETLAAVMVGGKGKALHPAFHMDHSRLDKGEAPTPAPGMQHSPELLLWLWRAGTGGWRGVQSPVRPPQNVQAFLVS